MSPDRLLLWPLLQNAAKAAMRGRAERRALGEAIMRGEGLAAREQNNLCALFVHVLINTYSLS
jgi:hypothetical protein